MREHFGIEPTTLPIVTESFDAHDHPNLHVVVDAFLAAEGRSSELMGVSSDAPWMEITFAH